MPAGRDERRWLPSMRCSAHFERLRSRSKMSSAGRYSRRNRSINDANTAIITPCCTPKIATAPNAKSAIANSTLCVRQMSLSWSIFTKCNPIEHTIAASAASGTIVKMSVANSKISPINSAIKMFTNCERPPAKSAADVRGGLPLSANPCVSADAILPSPSAIKSLLSWTGSSYFSA